MRLWNAGKLRLKARTKPSAIVLSRQKLPYINQESSKENKCEKGAYTVNVTSHENNLVLVASGSELELALDVQKKLKENQIESKVVSMPCMELFENQSDDYKREIFNEGSVVFTLEAGSVSSWHKYKGHNGYSFGIDTFGESAPYKKIYEHFNLTEDKILNIIQKHLRN